MDRFLIILVVAFFVGGSYSYLMKKFFRNKLIIFLPTLLSFIWLIYTVITFEKNNQGGFYDIAIFLSGIIVFTVALGNIVFNLIFSSKKNKNGDKNKNRNSKN